MKGVAATPDMHFRIGAMAIPYLINLTLQLEDEGKLSPDDKLAQYFPQLPEASEITLRNLASVTSGWPDWIQGNEKFQGILFEDPFRQWQPHELLEAAFAQPLPCPPNACFHYAHTNFLVLADVIKQVTGRSISSLIEERVFRPLGLAATQISRYPAMPGPVLQSYTGERGVYEDATYLPSRDISLAVVTTQLPRSSNTTDSFAGVLFSRIAAYLTPDHLIAAP